MGTASVRTDSVPPEEVLLRLRVLSEVKTAPRVLVAALSLKAWQKVPFSLTLTATPALAPPWPAVENTLSSFTETPTDASPSPVEMTSWTDSAAGIGAGIAIERAAKRDTALMRMDVVFMFAVGIWMFDNVLEAGV